ncbi:hypothetical protein JL722_6322 [Aureococcus anophagefferens]|nr:hypothetical protein JL722_6322 [Aureococcus anophagefferens]
MRPTGTTRAVAALPARRAAAAGRAVARRAAAAAAGPGRAALPLRDLRPPRAAAHLRVHAKTREHYEAEARGAAPRDFGEGDAPKRTRQSRRERPKADDGAKWRCGVCRRPNDESANECSVCGVVRSYNRPFDTARDERDFMRRAAATPRPRRRRAPEPDSDDDKPRADPERVARAKQREREREATAAGAAGRDPRPRPSPPPSSDPAPPEDVREAARAARDREAARESARAAPARGAELEAALALSTVADVPVEHGGAASLDAALASPRGDFRRAVAGGHPQGDREAWNAQVLVLRDLGFSPSVAAAYADSRVPLDAIIERMFEDGVDFEEEPVYAARERTVRTASRLRSFASSAASRVKDAFRGAASPKAGRAAAYEVQTAVPVVDAEAASSDDAWTPLVCPLSHATYWTNAVLELSSWSDPRTDPGATLYDARSV